MAVNEFTFVPAEKVQRKARIAVIGPSGCGKTYSALLIARGLVGTEGKIAVIDTEHASASLYARITPFETLVLKAPFTPSRYAQAAKAAAAAGYDVLVVDSMSQEWNGEGGILQMVEANKARIRNDFAAWNGPSQEHEQLLETLVALPIHVISTFQSKTEYAMTQDNGRTKVEKLGLGAVTRDGVEYRYDLVLEMTLDHKAVVTKSRISEFADQTIAKPDANLGARIAMRLEDGAAVEAPALQVVMSKDTRLAVEASVIGAQATPETASYQTAIDALKTWKYRSWSDFWDRGTEPQAQEVIALLAVPVTA